MRIPRKRALAALTLAGATVFAGVATAGTDSQNGVNQSLEVEISPTRLVEDATKKNPHTPLKRLFVEVGVNVDQGTMPPASHQVDIKFAKGVLFDNRGVPAANGNQLAAQTTDQARSQFKKSQIGTGTSVAACGSAGGSFTTFPGTVTAFNGTKGKNARAKGNIKIFLHAVTQLPTGPFTTVLTGTLNRKTNNLSVPVQPLGGGACSIQNFNTTIKKNTNVDGEKVSYVSAECPKSPLRFSGRFQFDPNPYNVSELNPTDEVTCKGK
jgi:hypothetical protein